MNCDEDRADEGLGGMSLFDQAGRGQVGQHEEIGCVSLDRIVKEAGLPIPEEWKSAQRLHSSLEDEHGVPRRLRAGDERLDERISKILRNSAASALRVACSCV